MGESESSNSNNAAKESIEEIDLKKCPVCGGSVKEGHLESPGHGYPRVFLSLEKTQTEEPVSFAVNAFVCPDCGHISLKAYLENVSP